MSFINVHTVSEFLTVLHSVSDSPLFSSLDLLEKTGFTIVNNNKDQYNNMETFSFTSDINIKLTVIYDNNTEKFLVVQKTYENNKSKNSRIGLPSNISYHYDPKQSRGIMGTIHTLTFLENGKIPDRSKGYYYSNSFDDYRVKYAFAPFKILEFAIINGERKYLYSVFGTTLSHTKLETYIERIKTFNHYELLNLHTVLTQEEINLIEILLHK